MEFPRRAKHFQSRTLSVDQLGVSGPISIYSAIPVGSFSEEDGEIHGSMGRVTKLSCIDLFNPGILESCARMLESYS